MSINEVSNIIVLKAHFAFVLPDVLSNIANSLFLDNVLEKFECCVLLFVNIHDPACDHPVKAVDQTWRLFKIGRASKTVHVLNNVQLLKLLQSIDATFKHLGPETVPDQRDRLKVCHVVV